MVTLRVAVAQKQGAPMADGLQQLQEMRQHILDQVPPEARFRPEDDAEISKHSAMLHGWTSELIDGFYNMLFGHSATEEIFQEGERPKVEGTLSAWWKRVVDGPRDDQFWDWMTFVGLVHVVRKVKNPMMIAAWGYIEDQVAQRAAAELGGDQALALNRAFARFGKTFNSLVAESYILHYLEAVSTSTGSTPALLDRLVLSEIDTMLAGARGTFN